MNTNKKYITNTFNISVAGTDSEKTITMPAMTDNYIEEKLLPFEKSEAYGFESLTDEELIAIIIRSGTSNAGCMQVAADVIKKSGGMGILGLQNISVKDLCRIDGIGKVKAIQLKSICELSRRMVRQSYRKRIQFRAAEDIASYCMEDMRHLKQEQLRVLLLDTKSRLLHEKIITIGTINSTILSPRELCREALLHDAAGFIMVHNHPSGDPLPSRDDIISTQRMKNASDILGLSMIDHIIIGDNKYISMKAENII